MKASRIPAATITRLSLYTRNLEALQARGVTIVSSKKLALMCQAHPAQIRKDLAYFGEFGVRGLGYYVKDLIFEIRKILGLNRTWKLALVGVGNLGTALVSHQNFAHRGFNFVAAFDSDSAKIGQRLIPGLIIEPAKKIIPLCRQLEVEIGVVTTPAASAQRVINQLAQAPVRSILNFAPLQVQVPEGVRVENVDLSARLDTLAYYLTTE